MSDNVKRGVRTAGQVVLATLAAGAVTQIWDSFNKNHSVDPTIGVVVVVICAGIVSWAQNMLEDVAGGGILVPTDREVGDAVLNKGVGAKKMLAEGNVAGITEAQIAGMARPVHRTQHRS